MIAVVPSLGLHPIDAGAFLSAMVVGYYGAMRVSEYLISGDQAKLLTRGDVTFSPDGLSMTINLKRTKTNKSGVPELAVIPARGAAAAVCPVAVVLKYLSLRDARFGSDPSKPFFGRVSGAALTPRVFNALLKRAGEATGVRDWRELGSHAFRAGSTTDAVANGADFLAIKAHGRWRSDKAPASYIRKEGRRAAAARGQGFLDGPTGKRRDGPAGPA